MSPEQVNGERLTFASDMYAFGVMLFELLTFQLPYQADGETEFFGAILRSAPKLELLKQAQVPDEVISVIKRCLEKQAENRFASFGEICIVLRRFVSPERLEQTGPLTSRAASPKNARTHIFVGAAAVLLLLASPAFWFFTRSTGGNAWEWVEAPVGSAAQRTSRLLILNLREEPVNLLYVALHVRGLLHIWIYLEHLHVVISG